MSSRFDAALKRQNMGYKFDVPSVGDEDWVSQFDAAEVLNIGMYRVAVLIVGRQLTPVHNRLGQAGVTTGSVARERGRRDGAGLAGRIRLFVSDGVRALARGI